MTESHWNQKLPAVLATLIGAGFGGVLGIMAYYGHWLG